MSGNLNRRKFLKRSVIASAGAAALLASAERDASAKPGNKTNEKGMPYGTIGDLKISRLILGSNTPGDHSRDLIYVSSLGRAYNTKERMLDTFELAESLGINTILQGNIDLIREYNMERGEHMRTIPPVSVTENDDEKSIRGILTAAMKKADDLAAAFYIMGDKGDYLARAKKIELVGTAMEVAKELGMVLGLGGHSLQVVIECEKNGIKPDFYVKTFHHDNYWSATPTENREPWCWYDSKGGNSYSGKTDDHNRFHDNIWCLDPEETAEVMQKVKVPWIAFKVLAAGAIHPREGFKYAFENGADFICAGMLDFQVRENVIIAKNILSGKMNRKRPWRG